MSYCGTPKVPLFDLNPTRYVRIKWKFVFWYFLSYTTDVRKLCILLLNCRPQWPTLLFCTINKYECFCSKSAKKTETGLFSLRFPEFWCVPPIHSYLIDDNWEKLPGLLLDNTLSWTKLKPMSLSLSHYSALVIW